MSFALWESDPNKKSYNFISSLSSTWMWKGVRQLHSWVRGSNSHNWGLIVDRPLSWSYLKWVKGGLHHLDIWTKRKNPYQQWFEKAALMILDDYLIIWVDINHLSSRFWLIAVFLNSEFFHYRLYLYLFKICQRKGHVPWPLVKKAPKHLLHYFSLSKF